MSQLLWLRSMLRVETGLHPSCHSRSQLHSSKPALSNLLPQQVDREVQLSFDQRPSCIESHQTTCEAGLSETMAAKRGRRFGRRAPLLRGARSSPSGGVGFVAFCRKAASWYNMVYTVQHGLPRLRAPSTGSHHALLHHKPTRHTIISV